jgi:branched-chain amino acid transport system substrate-binding protein
MKALRARRPLIAVVVVLCAATVGCGGLSGDRQDPIRIGVLADCQTPEIDFYPQSLAGAELPLLSRGGRLRGESPLAGVSGASVAGRRVELAFGCSGGSAGSSPTSSFLAEARRLVENEHVDALLAVAIPDEPIGNILADYARRQPGVAFVWGTPPAPAIMLRDPPANLFSFETNGKQWMSGLGAYAYRTLGWRRAVVIEGDPKNTALAWLQTAGFEAEFCALGGKLVKRVAAPYLVQSATIDLSQYAQTIAQVPRNGVDGFVVGESGTLLALARSYPGLRGSLARKVIFETLGLDPPALKPLARRLAGSVFTDNGGNASTGPAWDRYEAELHRVFPQVPVAFIGNSLDFTGPMEAILKALAAVHGYLSGGEKRFMSVLAKTRVDVAGRPMRLDAKRMAIGSNFIHKIEVDKTGNIVIGPLIKRIDNVDQTFGGYFSASSPLTSDTTPSCHRAKAPPWASAFR